MISVRRDSPLRGGYKVSIAVDDRGTRLINLGDTFNAVRGLPHTDTIAASPRTQINGQQYVTTRTARGWLPHLDDQPTRQQCQDLGTLLTWAESTPIGDDHAAA